MTCAEKYNHLDINMLMKKKGEIVSSKNALQNIEPILWDEERLPGDKKVILQKKKYKEET